jgi:hypothetical protein
MAIKYTNPYIPSFLKAALSDSRPALLTFEDLKESNIKSKTSFKYDTLDTPLKNTQQLNLDWSKFENHTFFQSAEVKTNIAFDRIINAYPFDGTKAEVENFFEKIDGFENWVFNQFPKFGGQLHFSGTQVGEDPLNGFSAELGTWISIKDVAGWLFPGISKNKSGESVLNPPVNKSFTIEAQVFFPAQVNDRQIVVQKLSQDKLQGFTFHIEPSVSTETVVGSFNIISGSTRNAVSVPLKKGSFNHVCMTLNREEGNNFLQFFVDEKLTNQSKKSKSIDAYNDKSPMLIGSGSSFYIEDGTIVTPQQTFSGTIDEFRLFHTTRTETQQRLYATKGLYASEGLKLYYRFNEPNVPLSPVTGDTTSAIVLDSSGNSLHSKIENFDVSLRQSSTDILNPVKNEKDIFKICLFPAHPDTISLNTELLNSASIYDVSNPNLITKLIPRHYLREGALSEGLQQTQLQGSLGQQFSQTGVPGQVETGSTQILLTFLYIWSKFFDEIKLFTDAFRTLRTVEYNPEVESIPENFLHDFIRSYGFYIPPFFNSSNITQYAEGEDINGIGVSNYALKYVQSQILRRVLVNMPDILRSKGTQHSIRSFLRAVGIDPDNSMRIREFGGPTKRVLGSVREARTETVGFANFTTASIVTTPFLTASRIEPGFPEPQGPLLAGTSFSLNQNDGILTSGSWTVEGQYKFGFNDIEDLTSIQQSLFRMEVTGSSATVQPGIIANVVMSGSLQAYVRPGMGTNSPLLSMNLPGPSILDGENWYIAFGCRRNDAIDSYFSSSYFITAAKQNNGEIVEYYTSSSYFMEQAAGEGNAFRALNSIYNASGSRLSIGSDPTIPMGSIGYRYLNSTLDAPDAARATLFEGQVSNFRFWSKALTDKEMKEHTKNYASYGVENAYTNFNYVNKLTGSFERLRMSVIEKQPIKIADSLGNIVFLDMSENEFHAQGKNFPSLQSAYFNNIISFSYISPYFDEFSTNEKIRIRGFLDEKYIEDSPWAVIGPAYELQKDEEPLDDPRLSIEFSLIDTLNRDIIRMFTTLDSIGNAIGNPELLFSPDYPDLENLRDIYFNRIKDKLNFRGFFEFYKWFDLSISTFIQQLVPRKTKFKGTNFVVESHMLERHKLEYFSNEIYLGDATRSRIRDVLLTQLIAGKITRY